MLCKTNFGNCCRNARDRRQRKPENKNDNNISNTGKPTGSHAFRSGGGHWLLDQDSASLQRARSPEVQSSGSNHIHQKRRTYPLPSGQRGLGLGAMTVQKSTARALETVRTLTYPLNNNNRSIMPIVHPPTRRSYILDSSTANVHALPFEVDWNVLAFDDVRNRESDCLSRTTRRISATSGLPTMTKSSTV